MSDETGYPSRNPVKNYHVIPAKAGIQRRLSGFPNTPGNTDSEKTI